MKVCIVGSDKVYAIENFYIKHLSELGLKVYHFTGQTLFLDYYHKSILNKILFKSGLSGIYKTINKDLKKLVETVNPDVVVIFKGMEIYPSTIQWLQQKGIKAVNYNPDNPFIFSGKGSGNSNVSESISLFDLYLTYDHEVRQRAIELGIRSEILPFGFELSDSVLAECKSEQEVLRTAFVGNTDKYRVSFLNQLAEEGIEIDVFGHEWDKYKLHKNIRFLGSVYEAECWKVLRKYRVQLNLMRLHNPASHNMRTFEIAGVGGIQLAPETIDHKTYFIPGAEIFLYSSVKECASQARYILSLSKNEADKIRSNARERSVSSAYTYKGRATELTMFLKGLL